MSNNIKAIEKTAASAEDSSGVLSIVYSFAKKAAIVGIVYFAGYMQWSVAWFICPVILAALRDQWRRKSERKRHIAQTAALSNEKDLVLARIDDLPSWVFFPDIERAEWLNRILKQMWPNVNHYARDLIRDSIQPSLQERLAKYKLNGFRFERIILGSVHMQNNSSKLDFYRRKITRVELWQAKPPRIGGVKVYETNVSRNEIIMDVDIFYAGDCDINFTVSGVKAGIKDFQLHGMMRVVMKPLITTIPLVGGLQVFFLNNPEIDFNLVGIADVLDMPGLSDMLRKVVVEQVAAMMVLPNKFPIKLSEDIEAMELKAPEPKGVLRVHVIEAKHLMKKDIGMLGKGKSDPYAVLTVGAQEFKTKVINNSVDPKWDYWCEAKINAVEAQLMCVTLYDWDPGLNDDDFLGRATIEVENIVSKGEEDVWITLEQAKHGMVHLRLYWLTLSSSYSDLKAAIEETQKLRVTAMSSSLLTVYVDSGKNLPQARSSSKPDPYAILSLGKNSQQTAVQMRTSDPVWEQGFTFLVANPESDTLYLNILDQKTGQELGNLAYNLSALADKKDLEIRQQPFGLAKSGPNSKIIISMHLRILKRNTPRKEMQADAPIKDMLERQTSTKSNLSEPTSKIEPVQHDDLEQIKQVPEEKPPSGVEDVIEDSSVPLLQASPSPTLDGNGIHQRVPQTTSYAGESGLGRIQLTLKYSIPRQKLVVVIHKVANLPMKDPSSIPDPYVKLYLLPERSKDTKRKTIVVKDNCNPIFDESFEYLISQGELNNKLLEVTVGTQKQLFYTSSNVLGQVIVDLGRINLLQPYNAWFDLQPEVDRS